MLEGVPAVRGRLTWCWIWRELSYFWPFAAPLRTEILAATHMNCQKQQNKDRARKAYSRDRRLVYHHNRDLQRQEGAYLEPSCFSRDNNPRKKEIPWQGACARRIRVLAASSRRQPHELRSRLCERLRVPVDDVITTATGSFKL